MKPFAATLTAVVILLVVGILGIGAFVYSGVYNIGADAPHTKPVHALIETLVDRSVERRAKDLVVPNLEEPQLVLDGAGHYAAMCTGCHLAPGLAENEMRPGLYPKPPQLAKFRPDPREAFWIIKHGIKMSAMPAWGQTHDDAAIWGMVAFLQKLPEMTPAQYKTMVANAPADDDMHMDEEGGHSHGGVADEDGHAHEHAAAAPSVEVPLSMDGLTPHAVPAAEAVAQAFHRALHSGDRAAVLALLAPDVSISEGGQVQSREAYASGHLGEDIAFLKAAQISPVSLGSMAMGVTAMVGSESEIKATIKGQPTTLRGREMLNLRQEGGAWKITSVQWQTGQESGK
jgi:mono/diheme cytochrome c family protein/ketosteroid isomerase-like protein